MLEKLTHPGKWVASKALSKNSPPIGNHAPSIISPVVGSRCFAVSSRAVWCVEHERTASWLRDRPLTGPRVAMVNTIVS